MESIIVSARKGDRIGVAFIFFSIAVIEVIIEFAEKIGHWKLRSERRFQIKIHLTIRVRIVAGEFVQKRILVRQVGGALKRDRYGRRILRRRECCKRAGLGEYLVPERKRHQSDPVKIRCPGSESGKEK